MTSRPTLTFDGARRATIRHLQTTDFRAIVATGGDETGLTHSQTLKNIVRMNELGLVTYDSQRGVSYAGHRERAYVLGAMKDAAARKFVDRVSESSDVLCFAPLLWPSRPSKNATAADWKRFDATFPTRFNFLWVTHDAGQPVTHLSLVMPEFAWEDQLNDMGIAPEHRGGVVPVVCVDLEWNRKAHTHLHKVVLRSLVTRTSGSARPRSARRPRR